MPLIDAVAFAVAGALGDSMELCGLNVIEVEANVQRVEGGS